MIYQFYFEMPQLANCQPSSGIYRPWGLRPEVNGGIAERCPEINTPAKYQQLSENAGILDVYRATLNSQQGYFGFTSHRQLEKNSWLFTDPEQQIEVPLVMEADVVAWYYQDVPEGVAARIETHHPGLHSYLIRMFADMQIELPASYFGLRQAVWCNYWVMSSVLFRAYMRWLEPFIAYTLRSMDSPTPQERFFLNGRDRHLGNLLEVVFQVWLCGERCIVYDPRDRRCHHFGT